MPHGLPVIAAIPNYNMAESLAELLPQIIKQNYDKIYVLDDDSADHSKNVVASFGSKVTWVESDTNLGSGGNRNRILEAHEAECIIHFLDADVRLLTDDIPDKARQVMSTPNTGFVGGLVIENGRQSAWNFGQYPDLHANLAGLCQFLFGTVQAPKPLWRKAIRFIMNSYLEGMPDLASTPKRQTVFWTHEANLLIRRSTLQQLGGFDLAIREHDIQVVGFKARQAGLTSYFDPLIGVEHTQLQVRGYNRIGASFKTARYIRRKYGLQLWF